MSKDDVITEVLFQVRVEVLRAVDKFKPFASSHEGFAVLKEEVDELWDEVKRNDLVKARAEAIQVAAMAIRFIMDVPTTKKGTKLRGTPSSEMSYPGQTIDEGR